LHTAPPTPDRSTASLHDALPIWVQSLAATLEELGDATRRVDRLEELDLAPADGQKRRQHALVAHRRLLRDAEAERIPPEGEPVLDRKSTRLNSSHVWISYAVCCLKKKTACSFFHFRSTLLGALQRIWRATKLCLLPALTLAIASFASSSSPRSISAEAGI